MHFRFLLALFLTLFAPLAHAQKNVQKDNAGALTESLTVGAGKTLTLSGGLTGTPTGGNLDLSAVTLTIPSSAIPTIGVTKGGTGLTTVTLGDIFYASLADTLARLSGNVGTTMAVLTQTGTGTTSAAPVWTTTTGTGSIVRATSPTFVTPVLGTPASGTLTNATGLPLSTGVTGTLPVGNGGTGLTTPGTSGNVLTSNGTAWISSAPGATTTITGTAGQVLANGTSGTTQSGNVTLTLAGTITQATTFSAGLTSTRNGIATTGTTGLQLANTTASTSGVPVQYSPRVLFTAHAWNTTATAADNYLEAMNELRSASAATPTSTLAWGFRRSTDGATGSFTDALLMSLSGTVTTLASGGNSMQVNLGDGNKYIKYDSGEDGVTVGSWGRFLVYSTSNTRNVFAAGITGFGYPTGAAQGGAVTQITSRTTGVTLNLPTGAVTLVSAAGSATWQSFTLTNSAIAATDVVSWSQKSGTDKYMIHTTTVSAGSCVVTFATTGGTTTEQPVFNFVVIKGSAN